MVDVVDPIAAEFFEKRLEQDASNGICADCKVPAPTWASVSHGIYLSIEASGVHRSLGVQVSRVQSINLDSWKPVHLRMMELGGNKRFADFLNEHQVPQHLAIREKYRTRAAAWYCKNLLAEAEGRPGPPPLEPGVGHLPESDADQSTKNPSPSHGKTEQLLLDKVFASAAPVDSMTPEGTASYSPGKRQQRLRLVSETPTLIEFEFDDCHTTRSRSLSERICDTLSRSLGMGPTRHDHNLRIRSDSEESCSSPCSITSTRCAGSDSIDSTSPRSSSDTSERWNKAKALAATRDQIICRPQLMSAAVEAATAMSLQGTVQ
jgi:hypothetical protein